MNPYVSPVASHATPYSPTASHATPYPQTTPQQAATIQPGSITYTTTVGADGQVVYHPFKAVSASYQTAQGVVSGIQWIPAEATSVLPNNATPADSSSLGRRRNDDDYRRRNDDSRNSRYGGDRSYADDDYYRRDEREEDRDYRRERKPSGYGRATDDYDKLERHMANLDLERHERDRAREREYERERGGRSRKGSTYGGERPPSTYGGERPTSVYGGERPTSVYGGAGDRPTSTYGGDRSTGTYAAAPGGSYPLSYNNTSAYPAAPGGNYPVSAAYRAPSPRPGDPLQRPVSPYRNSVAVPRPISPYHTAGALPAAPRPISPYQVPRATSPFQAAAIQRAASPYGGSAIPRAASPYSGAIPPHRVASPYHGASGTIYPPGHVMEGQSIRGGHISRAPSPSPYGPPAPLYANPNSAPASIYGLPGQTPYAVNSYGAQGVGLASHASPRGSAVPLDPTQQQTMLTVPEGFNRPPNRAQSYTQFEMMKVGDMDDLLDQMPRMPAVLVPHDVYHEDWIRLMTDLGMGWSGTMPVPQYSPDGRPPKRSTLVADVIDLWNASFFRARGVEAVLYKGRERRSGRLAGTVDMHLPGFDRVDVSSPSESDDSADDDSADDRYPYGAHGGAYGRGDTSRRRRERKAERAERRKRKMEKKIKKRQKELDRTYAMYLQCVPPSDDRM